MHAVKNACICVILEDILKETGYEKTISKSNSSRTHLP